MNKFRNFIGDIIEDKKNIKQNNKNLEFQLSECIKINIKNNDKNDKENKEPIIIEPEEIVEQLFDGYLGEKNFDPNPLEYGPNAMYRRNGTVYRKSVDNLWEVYLQDGKQGARGATGGSGVGVQEVLRLIQSNSTSTNLSGFENKGTYFESSLPIKLSNGLLLSPFVQRYVNENPSVSALTISASTSQRIAFPSGTSFRLWWNGVGPFAYRTGNSSVVALSTDFPAAVGFVQILSTTDTHIAVYGFGGGTLTIEAGDGAL